MSQGCNLKLKFKINFLGGLILSKSSVLSMTDARSVLILIRLRRSLQELHASSKFLEVLLGVLEFSLFGSVKIPGGLKSMFTFFKDDLASRNLFEKCLFGWRAIKELGFVVNGDVLLAVLAASRSHVTCFASWR